MSRIYEQLSTAILEGDAEKTPKLVTRALKEGLLPKDILDNGMVVGMNEVGVRFKAGDMFVPEVLMSADAMQHEIAAVFDKAHMKPVFQKIAPAQAFGNVLSAQKELATLIQKSGQKRLLRRRQDL